MIMSLKMLLQALNAKLVCMILMVDNASDDIITVSRGAGTNNHQSVRNFKEITFLSCRHMVVSST